MISRLFCCVYCYEIQLFRGGTESKIRKGMLEDDIVEAIVGLPEKLFYNTGIPASIIIIKPEFDNIKSYLIPTKPSFELQILREESNKFPDYNGLCGIPL